MSKDLLWSCAGENLYFKIIIMINEKYIATKKQQRVFDFCMEYVLRNKKFPLLREVWEKVNTTKQWAKVFLSYLEKRWYITKTKEISRGYVIGQWLAEFRI